MSCSRAEKIGPGSRARREQEGEVSGDVVLYFGGWGGAGGRLRPRVVVRFRSMLSR